MEYTADSNEALCLSLVRARDDADALSGSEKNLVSEFNPKFTYPIFGEEEKIYGYEDLEVQLKFTSGSLQQFLSINYSSKLSGAGSKVADDVEQTLFKFIPPDYVKSSAAFQKRVEADATTFRPVGEKIYSYTRKAEGAPNDKGKGKASDEAVSEDDETAVVYEVYWANWETPGFREYHRRMQLFVLLYIEGGSYIQEDEDKWEFVVLYEKRRRRDAARTETYHFVGYSSLYSFYCWPDRVRLRLSQFVITGPYQNKGHGAQLYNAIYQRTVGRDSIAELTVEDPSEAFEDLRDKCDLRMLFKDSKFLEEAYGLSDDDGEVRSAPPPSAKGKLGPPTNKEWAQRWKEQLKIAGRQWSRLIEMLILRSLPLQDAVINRAFRLQVKERLFRFNYEIMSQLDKQERHEKLEETFVSVRDDYRRILGLVE
ncbi:histone acetyltransferase 1 [Tulasnella sp. JGI-2019a]|nr:histone acetyltransferase 1 [Tulasnella sp. JGI-2019a]KAG9007078.1 histone acetyltransferase 1 [Tulasnella sp. JGI-2019a]KAG9033184.1 histone acetyltransferase 1 [Tulasnella sp. JGI-2019a]